MGHNRKRYVIVGNPDTIWVKKYIEKILIPENEYSIWIVDLGSHIKGLFSSFYLNNHISVIRIPKSKVDMIPFFGTWIYVHVVARHVRKELNPFVVHAHFITWQSICILALLKNRRNRVVASYWGSDILRETKRKLRLCKIWMRKVDKISLTTSEMRHRFNEIYGNRYNEKISSPFFGVNGYDALRNMKHESNAHKSEYGISPNAQTITIGYNGSRAQQHIKALEAVGRLGADLQSNIFVIVPMTYGVSELSYIDEIKEYLNSMKIMGYKILIDYMNDYESAILKCVTDIFIHAQLSDALSASIQEFLYAEKIVLNPKWIKYKELEDNGIYFMKYESFETLDSCICESIKYLFNGELKGKLQKNREILNMSTSWEAVAPGWRKLYQ